MLCVYCKSHFTSGFMLMGLSVTFSFTPLTTWGMVVPSSFLTTVPPLPLSSGRRQQHRNCCAGSEQMENELLPWVSLLAPSPQDNVE